jgi:SAM-dependent methyltransferase
MSVVENAYGHAKRLEFCAAVIGELAPPVVVDVGCGTGENLTRPLAERFPRVRFVGIDADPASIEYARRAGAPGNLEYGGVDLLAGTRGAGLVIASEVVEHVEDPEAFLIDLRTRLAPGGAMIVTLPNGRGPFEIASLLESLLRVSGVLDLLRRAKRALVGGGAAPAAGRPTLASSPHINFFSWTQINALFARAGLAVRRFQPWLFCCGFGFDFVLRSARWSCWNTRVADRLPAPAISAWMFLLEPAAQSPAPPYRRGPIARWRRRLNERLAGPA